MDIVIAYIGGSTSDGPVPVCFGPFDTRRKAKSFATKNFKDKGYKFTIKPVINPEKIPKYISW